MSGSIHGVTTGREFDKRKKIEDLDAPRVVRIANHRGEVLFQSASEVALLLNLRRQ